jgi:hypothetical protein
MWKLLEPIHVVTYFTPEARAAADALGMKGFWMGYTAQRVAPMGAVSAAIATAAFFGFHPDRIGRAVPEAWTLTTPADALAARLKGAGAALRRLWGDAVTASAAAEAAELAWQAATAADCAGRVLGAANQALPRPDQPHLALWQAATTLREHRGDGHVAALVARGVTPVQAHQIKCAAGETDPEVLRTGRKFDEATWTGGAATLGADGVLTADGQLTAAGRRLHADIEDATDVAAATPWRVLGESATARLATLLAPLAAVVLDSGTLPQLNPVGLVADRAR